MDNPEKVEHPDNRLHFFFDLRQNDPKKIKLHIRQMFNRHL